MTTIQYQHQLDRVRRLTKLDKKTITQRLGKLTEELGELAEAILSETNAPGCEYKPLGEEEVLEEGIDVLIVCFSILSDYGFLDEEILSMLTKKLDKWDRVLKDTYNE